MLTCEIIPVNDLFRWFQSCVFKPLSAQALFRLGEIIIGHCLAVVIIITGIIIFAIIIVFTVVPVITIIVTIIIVVSIIPIIIGIVPIAVAPIISFIVIIIIVPIIVGINPAFIDHYLSKTVNKNVKVITISECCFDVVNGFLSPVAKIHPGSSFHFTQYSYVMRT